MAVERVWKYIVLLTMQCLKNTLKTDYQYISIINNIFIFLFTVYDIILFVMNCVFFEIIFFKKYINYCLIWLPKIYRSNIAF